MVYAVTIEGKSYRLELTRQASGWNCRVDGRPVHIDAVLSRRDVLSLVIDGTAYEVKREAGASDLHFWVGSARYAAEVRDPRSLRARKEAAAAVQGSRKLVAPMPGRIVRVLVSEKDQVEAGQGMVVIEAMKMQNELKAPKKGMVRKMTAVEGANVNAGDVLAIVE
jgi:biotin carboxyl carrier protein